MVCKIGVPLFLMVSGALLLGRGIGSLNACIVYVLLVFSACAVLVWIGRKIPGVRFFFIPESYRLSMRGDSFL